VESYRGHKMRDLGMSPRTAKPPSGMSGLYAPIDTTGPWADGGVEMEALCSRVNTEEGTTGAAEFPPTT